MSCSYGDMIHLPHHQSATRPHMPPSDRAAQFSPFAALTGYEAGVREAARRTETKPELDENEQALLDERLRILQGLSPHPPVIEITFFEPDDQKEGGAYRTLSGQIRKIDPAARILFMENGIQIPMDAVIEIAGDLFLQEEGSYEPPAFDLSE